MVYDSFNYDESRGLWCPLAIGLDMPRLIDSIDLRGKKLTNEQAKAVIREIAEDWIPGFTLNPISGVPGRFYRESRADDIDAVCLAILKERHIGAPTAAPT